MADFTIDTGMVDGKTIAEWTQDWWKWSLNLTDGQNPFTHPNGNFTDVNNDGSVFFIAGVSQKHPFDVPHGPLLVPLVNFVDTAPETPPMEQTETNNLAMFDSSVDVQSLFAKIDGVAVSDLASHLVDSAFFDPGVAQKHTLATDFYGVAPPGVSMAPAKSGGYWLMIDNLAPGPHTLEFGGEASSFGGISVSVTDHINVV